MRSIVIYFSQTGNTEKIAFAIYEGLKQVSDHCDIVKIKDANPRRLRGYDLIGIGTPVFGYVEPVNVQMFIKDMRFVGGKHVFAFATHGTHGEYFASSISQKLQSRGLIVLGVRDWYGNCYIPGAPDPYPTAGHPDEIDCQEANEFGQEMGKLSKKIYTGATELIPPLPLPPEKSLDQMLEELHAKEKERGAVFEHRQIARFEKEKCIYPECTLCMENCPLDGIDLTVNPPIIGQPCMHCMFCAKICPTGAIDHLFLFDTPAEKTWRSVPEFHLDHLVQEEAAGRFRRLVPVDKIGLNTPYYIKHHKRPWWIIGKGLQ